MTDKRHTLPKQAKDDPVDKRSHPTQVQSDKSAMAVAKGSLLVSIIAMVISGLQWRAASEGLTQSAQAVELSQRAWISLQRVDFHASTDNQILRFISTLENVGNTPASDVRFSFWVSLADDMNTPKELGKVLAKPPLMPRTTSITPAELQLTSPLLSDFTSGRKVAYAHGLAEYQDVFKKVHHTRICVYKQAGSHPVAFCPTPGHNAAD